MLRSAASRSYVPGSRHGRADELVGRVGDSRVGARNGTRRGKPNAAAAFSTSGMAGLRLSRRRSHSWWAIGRKEVQLSTLVRREILNVRTRGATRLGSMGAAPTGAPVPAHAPKFSHECSTPRPLHRRQRARRGPSVENDEGSRESASDAGRDVMSGQGWMNATTALRLAFASALLLSCTSDTRPGELTARTSAALNTSPTIGNFALYAARSINIGSFDQVSGGDIGVALPTVSTFGPQLVVGAHAQNHLTEQHLVPNDHARFQGAGWGRANDHVGKQRSNLGRDRRVVPGRAYASAAAGSWRDLLGLCTDDSRALERYPLAWDLRGTQRRRPLQHHAGGRHVRLRECLDQRPRQHHGQPAGGNHRGGRLVLHDRLGSDSFQRPERPRVPSPSWSPASTAPARRLQRPTSLYIAR